MSTLFDAATERLRAAGIESPRLEARLLLAHVLSVSPNDLVMRPMRDTGAQVRLDTVVARRIAREPLAYILGKKEFWSLDFAVGPGVLVPRPESETLVEEALCIFPDRDVPLSVLDLGTGSGCLLLSFLGERPNARGLGVDTSPEALRYARRNAEALSLAARATFEERDWANGTAGTFDAIFVNPPYLTESELVGSAPEVAAEPRAALLGGADGLMAYRSLVAPLAACLAPSGRAFVELGHGQADAAASIFSSGGLATIGRRTDLSGIPRCLVLAAACPSGQKDVGNPRKSG